MENSEVLFEFTYLHAVFIVGSIFTYIVDLILGKYYKNIVLIRLNLILKTENFFCIFCSLQSTINVLGYILDVIVAITYLYDSIYYGDPEGYWYCFTTVCLVLLPTIGVQIFSIRWHQMDSKANSHPMAKSFWFIHSVLLGVVHR